MTRALIKAALIATVSTFAAGHAGAASHDYFLKLDGVKGESTKGRQHMPLKITKGTLNTNAGVSVAAGDVTGDGRDDIVTGAEASGAKAHARVRGGLNPADQIRAPHKPQQGLLVPAVQQVRGSR
jgi:hypothetical protein